MKVQHIDKTIQHVKDVIGLSLLKRLHHMRREALSSESLWRKMSLAGDGYVRGVGRVTISSRKETIVI